jgi:hypothetical protein
MVPMVERLPDMPQGMVRFRAPGEIEREDHDDVLVPELRRRLAGEPRVFPCSELGIAKARVAGA